MGNAPPLSSQEAGSVLPGFPPQPATPSAASPASSSAAAAPPRVPWASVATATEAFREACPALNRAACSPGGLSLETLADACCPSEEEPHRPDPVLADPRPPGAASAPAPVAGVSEADRTRYYKAWDSIRGALTGGDTVLLRANWVQEMHSSGRRKLPRWQDLPVEAYWDAEELLREVTDQMRPSPQVIALSYSWLSRDHPDPEGFHLDIWVPMLKHYARYSQVGMRSIAVFYDWCSLPQRPWSASHEKAHKRALRNIDLWYAHTLTDVWLLSSTPDGVIKYEDRGWPGFETAAAGMLSPVESIVDLGRVPSGWRNWSEVAQQCRTMLKPPELPDAFAERLQAKSFACSEDRKLVADKYWGVFHRGLGGADQLLYEGLGWGDADVQSLVRVLPRCPSLLELSLRDNEFGAVGALLLARALDSCPALEVLNVANNCIGEEAQKELVSAWARASKPEGGLDVSDQRPSTTSGEADRAAALALDRAASVAAAAASQQPGSPLGRGPAMRDESKQALNAMLARQAAFEARIESAMAKVAESVVELSGMVDVPTPHTSRVPERVGARDLTGEASRAAPGRRAAPGGLASSVVEAPAALHDARRGNA